MRQLRRHESNPTSTETAPQRYAMCICSDTLDPSSSLPSLLGVHWYVHSAVHAGPHTYTMSLVGKMRVGPMRNRLVVPAATKALRCSTPGLLQHHRVPTPTPTGAPVLRRALPRGRQITVVSQASAQPLPSAVQSKEVRFKRSVWTAIDAVALLGSVGGALVALLGLVTPAYALTLPLVLPVVSLIAALQREDLGNEVGVSDGIITGCLLSIKHARTS